MFHLEIHPSVPRTECRRRQQCKWLRRRLGAPTARSEQAAAPDLRSGRPLRSAEAAGDAPGAGVRRPRVGVAAAVREDLGVK